MVGATESAGVVQIKSSNLSIGVSIGSSRAPCGLGCRASVTRDRGSRWRRACTADVHGYRAPMHTCEVGTPAVPVARAERRAPWGRMKPVDVLRTGRADGEVSRRRG